MKEITTKVIMRLTFIEKVPDSMADYYIESERNLENKRKYEQMVSKALAADKADICSMKHFIMDVDHEVFFDDSDKYEQPSLYPTLVNSLLLNNPQIRTEVFNHIEERLKERCKL